ncbi:MAG: 2-octaprenyl-6-methoxyphenyl hydroxylase [Gammaproteobacteria bacterium]|nr:2-octaprenyl-6-methoxyphenyl hydroxylase [Gammaproteobacteria bacterium]
MTKHFDVIIIGGGLVGAMMALALEPLGLNIAMVESQPEKLMQTSSLEVRSLALAYGSAKILQGMGLWEAMQPQLTPIKHIHVSDRGHFGFARLDAEQSKVEALGYVIEIPVLLSILYQQLNQSKVSRFTPATLISLDQSQPELVNVQIQAGEGPIALSSKLVLGADGGNSTVRKLIGIEYQEHDYQQVAIACNLALKRSHHNQAYERFTAEGPLALLPLSGQRMSVVWTVNENKHAGILAQSDAEFLSHIQQAFGYRAGRFMAAGHRQAYPLTQLKVTSHYKGRVGLIGNSAHSLHPVGGQGFNLSMRDIAGLAAIIAEAHYQARDLNESIFERYVELRKLDQSTMLTLTDGLVKIFSSESCLWALPRNLALQKVERCPPIKSEINKLMMGRHGRLNRLSRGFSLSKGAKLL